MHEIKSVHDIDAPLINVISFPFKSALRDL